MTFSSNCFLCLFLAVLTTHAIVPSDPTTTSDESCPEPGLVDDKLVNLSTALNNINNSLISIFDLIGEQCPCVDASNCFETQLSNFRTALEELIDDVDNATLSVTTDCPDRTGAVFVAACDGTDVAVVDPNGAIQNGFSTDTNATGWAVYINDDTYGFDYFRNDPFEVRCRRTPDGMEVQLGNDSNDPLTMSAEGTGIVYDPDTENDYVAISFDNETLNGIYSFNRTVYPRITLLFGFDGVTGKIRIHDGFVYMIDGNKIVRRRLDGSDDWTTFIPHPANIKCFDVADNGQVVFSDTSGFVYWFDPVSKDFRQLKTPIEGITCGFSTTISPCDSLLYVANTDDPVLEIYNLTSKTRVGSLTYTESTPSSCPSVAFDPTFWFKPSQKPRLPN